MTKNNKLIFTLLLALVFTLSITTLVFAATSNPGIQLGNWIQQNVAGLFVGVVAVLGIIVILKRQLMAGAMLLIFAGLAAVFIYGGSEFSQKIGDLIKSWF